MIESLTIKRIEHLLNLVNVSGKCWNFPQSTNGYARTSIKGKSARAHRVFYALFKGNIPQGMTIDHLCKNKICVNPTHLEVVTIGDNVRRHYEEQTHCPNGHEYTEDNIYRWAGRGCRECRQCRHNSANKFKKERIKF